jgi:hypothetical protein
MKTARWGVCSLCFALEAVIAVPQARADPVAFGYTDSIANYTVPATGYYEIQATGAGGGAAIDGGVGGLGSQISDIFKLTAGETLAIAVGGAGQDGTYAGGGGGGSFVVGPGNTPLLVAGGGGGGSTGCGTSGCRPVNGGNSAGIFPPIIPSPPGMSGGAGPGSHIAAYPGSPCRWIPLARSRPRPVLGAVVRLFQPAWPGGSGGIGGGNGGFGGGGGGGSVPVPTTPPPISGYNIGGGGGGGGSMGGVGGSGEFEFDPVSGEGGAAYDATEIPLPGASPTSPLLPKFVPGANSGNGSVMISPDNANLNIQL